NQLCGFELKFRRKMFTHEVTYRVGEVRISPPIRWPVSVCHYTAREKSAMLAVTVKARRCSSAC
ncbi:MAG: hypothetical protein ACR5LH_14470, partial [Sodalis sp. (in: enterobacteria)]